MTGHAGCSVSTALGPEGRRRPARPRRTATRSPSSATARCPRGIVFEALNNAGGLKKNLLVILNDNKMSICPRVGGLAEYLDQCRMTGLYQDWQADGSSVLLNASRSSASMADAALEQFKDAIKASLHGGMLFEELGFRYFGPIDGHDLPTLRKYPRDGQGAWTARSCCTS